MNKFSVRYYIKCIVNEESKKHTDDESDNTEEIGNEIDVSSSSYELQFWR